MRVPILSASANTMLSKIFKKNETPPPPASTAKQAGPTPAQVAAQLATQLADKGAWERKLQTAMGDDAALLAIAKESPLIDIKYAAVEALVSEDALKRAEREFRDHDRRVHRAAKQRYELLVNKRLAAVSAAKLIETAAVLLHEVSIPANRLVELDRAWSALDATLLEDKQIADYQALWTKVSALTRERGEQQLQAKRWLAESEPALANLIALCVDIATGVQERSAFYDARTRIDAVLANVPVTQLSAQATQIESRSVELQHALQLATAIDARLILLEELQQPALAAALSAPVETGVAPMESPAIDATDTAEPVVAVKPPSPGVRWRALPAVADVRLAALLDARFAQWQTAKYDAKQARTVEAKQHARDESKVARQARADALAVVITDLVRQAEAALAEGHLAETAKYLTAIDETSGDAKGVAIEKILQARIETLQSETARLKGWQHWGGGRVREDIVVEAETLAKVSAGEKIAIKQHADAIESLRNRWKELDKLGGATSRSLWQRFDSALKTAFLPVAAHLAKLKAVRQENLAARSVLLDNLDGVKLADAPASETPDTTSVTTATPDWRALARAIEHFQTEWRKCGPVEHTVPHKAQAALAARMKASIARLDAPLSEARRVAQLEREKLIARAKALAADTRNRDVITKVRELQTEWQTHAKSLPLMRQVENALWMEFKSATDAVFTQRDAMHAARDAEFKANQTTREALIARLTGLSADSPPGEIKRTLADVDSEWRKCGEAPRSEAAKLDAQFRAVREAAQQYLAGSAKRGWHQICDALDARLALCVDVESNGATDDIAARCAVLPALPAVWEKALDTRLRNAQRAATVEVDEDDVAEAADAIAARLLQLESALDIESLPAFQAARRDLKLRAMKAAIEGRQSAAITNADIETWLGEVFAQAPADTVARERTAVIINALRNKPLR